MSLLPMILMRLWRLSRSTWDKIDLIRSLPRYKDHGDPFDRLIICQALSEKLPIITSDGKMSRYGVEVIW